MKLLAINCLDLTKNWNICPINNDKWQRSIDGRLGKLLDWNCRQVLPSLLNNILLQIVDLESLNLLLFRQGKNLKQDYCARLPYLDRRVSLSLLHRYFPTIFSQSSRSKDSQKLACASSISRGIIDRQYLKKRNQKSFLIKWCLPISI